MFKRFKIKITIPTLVAVSIFAIALLSYAPAGVNAEYDKFQIPEISGTITVTEERENNSDKTKIILSEAMGAAENSVDNGKAMWGKIDVVQGFLVYKIGVLASDEIFHIAIIDAGNGKTLYVSDGISKKDWKSTKHSDNESHKKWKDHYANMTPEEREVKQQQWSEVKEAFFALSLDERAKLIMHFMSMKVQLESLSDEEKESKKMEMKGMMEELLPLSIEEKTKKLQNYIKTL